MADFGSHPDSARNPGLLRCGVSLIAICALAAATQAQAQTADPTKAKPANKSSTANGAQLAANQGGAVANSTDAPPPPSGAIVVTGIRQSLRNSQQIKRNSDTVVDAITAQDIGALPDRSVTEALQRVPGVSIAREKLRMMEESSMS